MLSHLVDKSLVSVEREQEDEARYRLLETVRQYAREKLAESGEGSQVRDWHLAFFLELMERVEPEFLGPNQAARLSRLAGTLWWFWRVHGHLIEGGEWLERLLAKTSARTVARAKALCMLGGIALWVGGKERALSVALAEESLAIHRELGDKAGIAWSLSYLGQFVSQEQSALSRSLDEESLALFREVGDRNGIAVVLLRLGNNLTSQGEVTQARSLVEESLSVRRAMGGKLGIASALQGLGAVAFQQGDLALAQTLLEEALGLWRELGDQWGVGGALNLLGELARFRGDYVAARLLYEESLTIDQEIRNKRAVLDVLHNLSCVMLHQSDGQQATALFRDGLAQSQELEDKKDVILCLMGLASVAGLLLKQPQRAARLFGASEALLQAMNARLDKVDQTEYDRHRAAISAALGDEAFNAMWEEGEKMSEEEAVKYALEESATDGHPLRV